MFNKRSLRVLVIVAVVFALATVAYASAAANTVDPSKAGDGNAAVSGYTVTNVHYTLNTDPTKIQTVQFDLGATAAAGNVQVGIGTGAGPSYTYTYYPCTVLSGTVYTCSVAGANTVLEVTNLRVIAAQ
jgi:hypothetical protein